jgi:hypothetical protein
MWLPLLTRITGVFWPGAYGGSGGSAPPLGGTSTTTAIGGNVEVPGGV